MKFEKIKLPYSYDALEPYIDAKTVETHYEKHHTAYENGFNKAIEGTFIEEKYSTLEEVLHDYWEIEDDNLANAVKTTGGGLFNHNFYWSQFITDDRDLTPEEEETLELIVKEFGSREEFIESFVQTGLTVFGSGWIWLVKYGMGVKVITTPNQENPVMEGMSDIIIGVDLWEHAYYLKYQQNRKEYIENVLKLTLVKEPKEDNN